MNNEHTTPGFDRTALRAIGGGPRRLAIVETAGADRTPFERATLLPLSAGAEIVRVRAREETRPDGRRAVRLEPVGAERLAEGPELLLVERGPASLRTRLFGSEAERIVRGTDHPVLVTRGPARRPYARAVVATDFSAVSGEALRLGLSLLPPDAEVPWVLHAYDTSYALVLRTVNAPADKLLAYQEEARRNAEKHMEEFLDRHRLSAGGLRGICRPGDPVDVIRRYARDLGADLLVIGKHQAAGAGRPLMGTTAERCVRTAPCDLLVVPQRPPTLH